MTTKMKHIKADMKRLSTLFEAIVEVFPSNQNTLISVILHNMFHDASHCINYIGDEMEWERMQTTKRAIEAMKVYRDYHLIGFLVEEIEMSFMGHEMDEFEEIATKNDRFSNGDITM